MKTYLKRCGKSLTAFLTVFLIAGLLISCVGIGDGALFDNITTREKNENGVTEPEADVFCQIYPGMSPLGTVTTRSIRSLELLTRLMSEEYLTDVDRTTVEKPYYELIYQGTEDKHYIIYEDDFVFEKVNKANLDTNDSHSVVSLGKLTGAYAQTEEVYLDTLNAVTDEERDAGFKLNCLQVEMKPEISRIFYLSDFEDIGGFYLFEINQSQPSFSSSYNPYEPVIVYFKSCTPEELEEKIALIKQKSVVKTVSRIIVMYPDSK